jgi:hypothetical protein
VRRETAGRWEKHEHERLCLDIQNGTGMEMTDVPCSCSTMIERSWSGPRGWKITHASSLTHHTDKEKESVSTPYLPITTHALPPPLSKCLFCASPVEELWPELGADDGHDLLPHVVLHLHLSTLAGAAQTLTTPAVTEGALQIEREGRDRGQCTRKGGVSETRGERSWQPSETCIGTSLSLSLLRCKCGGCSDL